MEKFYEVMEYLIWNIPFIWLTDVLSEGSTIGGMAAGWACPVEFKTVKIFPFQGGILWLWQNILEILNTVFKGGPGYAS